MSISSVGRLPRQKLLLGAMASHVGALGEAAKRRRLVSQRPSRAAQRETKAQRSEWLGRTASARASAAASRRCRRASRAAVPAPRRRAGRHRDAAAPASTRAAGPRSIDLAGVEHHHLVADGAHGREVVADEHVARGRARGAAPPADRGSRRRRPCRARRSPRRRGSASGSAASARARLTRCFWPPESSPGRRSSSATGRCTRSSSSPHPASRASPRDRP